MSIVRISGPQAKEIGRGLTKEGSALYKKAEALIFIQESKKIDKALITFYKGPNYTQEKTRWRLLVTETHNRSGNYKNIMQTRARSPNPGSSRCALLNRKIDLVQAESVAAIVNAKSLAAATINNKILSGNLSKAIEKIRNDLISWFLILNTKSIFLKKKHKKSLLV